MSQSLREIEFKELKESQKRRNLKRRLSGIQKLIEYLKEHPCIDCGEVDIDVLTFDHVNGEKEASVYTLARSYTWSKVLKEIEKCEVRCANCHTKRHRNEKIKKIKSEKFKRSHG